MVLYQAGVPRILTIQGHPEFTPDIVKKIIDRRMADKVFSDEVGREALRRVRGKSDAGGEGLGRVGWGVWNMMLA